MRIRDRISNVGAVRCWPLKLRSFRIVGSPLTRRNVSDKRPRGLQITYQSSFIYNYNIIYLVACDTWTHSWLSMPFIVTICGSLQRRPCSCDTFVRPRLVIPTINALDYANEHSTLPFCFDYIYFVYPFRFSI